MLVALLSDGQPPLKPPTWRQRQRAEIDRKWEGQRRARGYSGRATDLQLAVNLDGLIPHRASDQHGITVTIDQLDLPGVTHVRAVPRDLDEHRDGGRDWAGSGDRPTAA
jgi:hypothetical protein